MDNDPAQTKEIVRSAKRFDQDLQFDYARVTSPVAKFLRGQADRIRRAVGESIVRVGDDLIAAKRCLSHGSFLNWVESEVGIPARTAQAYMQVTQWAKDKCASVAHLPPSLLFVLSAPSTPKEFADAILKRLEDGERITLADLRIELKGLRGSRRKEPNEQAPVQQDAKSHDQDVEPVTLDADRQPTLEEAVAIMARGLSRLDFARICRIMTSRPVLEDTGLAQKIAAAFVDMDSSNSERSPPSSGDVQPQGGVEEVPRSWITSRGMAPRPSHSQPERYDRSQGLAAPN